VCICVTCCWLPRVSTVHHLSSFVHTPHIFTILPTCFVLISFHPFYVELLGCLIWLSKKGRKETTKERVKARCRITKKKQKKESERRQSEIGTPHILTSIFGAPKLSNSAPLIFGKQDHPILCAIFSSQRFGAPSPPLHAYLPHPPLPFFCSVSLGSRNILYVFAPLFNFTFDY
jgi:hypothetical protein